ncbi:uncharacterized protein LOC132284188 [Cornus florida]|uniref:uncharacterized protein LOC132284188 n=1 Tax=Cornus florida TaxID=4283 RepID=UPI0028999CA6|nr:uncharacterized protein LOC132284188 [Cornus florida]
MATSSREARRRRIVDRGSDRLALITGRIQTLPSSSSSLEPYDSETAPGPPLISHEHHDRESLLSVSPRGEDQPFSSLLPKHETGRESAQFKASHGEIRGEQLLRKHDTISESSRSPAGEVDDRVQPSLVSSAVQISSVSASDTEHRFQPHIHHRKLFTPNQIRSAVSASESTRIYCSLAAAILVVLSYVGFPVLGSYMIKNIVLRRPLYLLLLTNISIVLARLLLENQRGFARSEQGGNNIPSIGGNGLAEQVGNALESGLVLQNIMGAVFMDCSVYAIVVICGLSLAQKVGW